MPDIELGFSIPLPFVILLAVGAWGFSWFTYLRTLPPLPRGKRLLLTSLRGTALSLLLLLPAEPLLRFVNVSTHPPRLTVLVDNSRSMGLTDRAGSRPDVVASLLRDGPLNRLAVSGTIDYSTFGTRLTPFPGGPPDSLSFNEEATDIAGAFRSLAASTTVSNTRAVLLISDGTPTLGRNPLYDAEHLGLPLFTVGIGDSSEQKDLLITTVLTNDRVEAGTDVPVDVTVRTSGFDGRKVEVRLLEEGTELARSQLALERGTHEYRTRLSYVPRGEGMKKYTVRISELEGELTTENNRRSFFARIQKSRLRLLIVAGGPSPDLASIRQTLSEQKNFDVRAVIERPKGGLYEGDLRQATFDSADCLLLVGFPARSTTPALLDAVRGALDRNTTPVLSVDGKQVDGQRLAVLAPFLPFSSPGAGTLEQPVSFQETQGGSLHPVLGSGRVDPTTWQTLPPLFRRQATFRAKPEATVLALARLQNLPATEPLMLLRSVGNAKSFSILGYGLWRWRLMVQGDPETESLLASLLGNAVRWLTTRDDGRPVAVSPTAEVFTSGERASFTGRVRDASAQPVGNARVTVLARHGNEEYGTVLAPLGNGLYEGGFDGLPAGDYTYDVTAAMDGQPLGTDRGRFAVGAPDLEFLDTRMNVTLLRQLAARTGGRFFRPGETGELADAIAALPSFVPQRVERRSENELWNWKLSLGALVLLFAAEWFIRKRGGLL